MSVKTTALIGASVIVLAVGATQALEPRSPQEFREQHQQQQVQDAADAQENSNQRTREQGLADAEAERRDRLNPGEHRPGSHPRLRLRLP